LLLPTKLAFRNGKHRRKQTRGLRKLSKISIIRIFLSILNRTRHFNDLQQQNIHNNCRFTVGIFLRLTLLDCHTLCQVPGLVDVAASADGYVVGEELEGDYFQDWQEEFGGLGDLDGVLD
jgi:hypothetical protein